jgi:hypothetical protein
MASAVHHSVLDVRPFPTPRNGQVDMANLQVRSIGIVVGPHYPGKNLSFSHTTSQSFAQAGMPSKSDKAVTPCRLWLILAIERLMVDRA